MESQAFVVVPEIETMCSELLHENKINETCDLISKTLYQLSFNENIVGNSIYTPNFDRLINIISDTINGNATGTPNISGEGKLTIILTTELYTTGGHTRIVEDLQKIYPKSIIIMTGYFGGIPERASGGSFGIKNLPILSLPIDSATANIIRLSNFLNLYAQRVFLLTHHHDVVANCAAAAVKCDKYFIHHSDHRPSLGATNDRFHHVDIVDHMRRFCEKNLANPIIYWPQSVPDYGIKKFIYPLSNIQTASSGTSTKFKWDGSLSYPNLIKTILTHDVHTHWHIGPLSDEQLMKIRIALQENNIEIDRFKYISNVESLWQALVILPINLLIGSAPMHGLRTAIESQGAGIPVLPFTQQHGSILDDRSMYAHNLSWENFQELCQNIKTVYSSHNAYSISARKFYEFTFSPESLQAFPEIR